MKPLKNILIGIGILVTITIIAMAAAPELSDGNVTPSTGNTTTFFDFSVIFTDADNDTAEYVKVTIDGIDYDLSETDSDNNTTDGKRYSNNTIGLFSAGHYTYNFTAKDDNTTESNMVFSSDESFTVTEVVIDPALIDWSPNELIFSTPNSTAQEFGVKFDQDVTNVTWEIDGTVVDYNGAVTEGTWANYTDSTAGVGEYTVRANGSNANGSDSAEWTWTVADSTSPESITNLANTTGMTWINWTWDNPGDADFDHVEVYLDGVFQLDVDKPQNYHNATGLASNRTYEIATRTADTDNNVNSTWRNGSATTLPNTPTGTDVSVNIGGVTIVFSNVITSGNTTVITNSTSPGTHYFDEVSDYHYIATTATYSGTITISIPYSSTGDESLVKLYHYLTGSWVEANAINVDQINDKVSGEVKNLSPFVAGVPPKPEITVIEPNSTSPETPEEQSIKFNISVDQVAMIRWYVNDTKVGDSLNKTNITLTKNTGTYIVNATASNANGSADNASWILTVRSRFYNTGNRIWAADMNLNTTYKWTAQSFSGFFYDIDNNMSSETMTITLASNTNRNIDDGKLVYESKPVNIKYEHDGWGDYRAIGFLAAKYFAGYIKNDVVKQKDMVSKGYLSKVLIDEDKKHTITIGSTLPLEEGYVLKAIDISVDDSIVRFVLLKDGEEVSGSHDIVNDKDEFVYEKQIGSVKDVPIIIVYVDTVFHGRETDMVQIKGVFQISDSPTKIETGDTYGIMKVKSKSGSGIELKNDDSFDLSRDSTVEIMGDIKFKVADSDTLRFAPFVEGLEELRGTVSCSDGAFDWTPFNFEGLYYDFDTGLGSETLKVISASGSSIDENDLVYESKPINTEFEHDDWGMYDLIGFMAEKYFAAYNNTNTEVSSDKDLLSKGYLSKVLIDEDKKHTITIGSTLPLEEGYVLKAIDISVDDSIVRFVLLKDGEEVSGSHDIVNDKDEFVYEKQIGSVKDVPIIIVYVDTVFHGRETDMVQIKGVFQISENPIEIDSGDEYGIMEVTSTSHGIEMKNKEERISLGAGDTIDVMGEIRFRVADNSTSLRYYPFITVDVEAEAASKLGITAPDTASERDTITIGITAGGESIAGSDVEFDGENIGTTDVNGEVLYELTSAGNFTINATKLGYESASKTITVEEYSETQLRIESVSELLQTDTFELTVTAGETPLSGVDVFVDDNPVGVTGTDGIFSYMFDTSGTHTVKVEKEGYDAAEKTVNVIKPSAEFKAVAFNITPVHATHKEPVFVTADIKNTGNIKGEHVVELRINGSVVASQNTTLDPGEVTTLNFTYTESEPGTYFAEIENMGGEFQVVKKSIGWLVYAGIITAIGLIVIYLVTMRREAIAPIIAPIGSKVVAAKGQLASKLSQMKTKIKK
ncbi:MAG: S-layer protein [Candidatus Argoarchaeum ethanivorans]|uniref:S-layer protein n=1 Tax=Candidatus Argoarchaeum ethanivorans TaxID=2608793 RepID=A0A811TDW2_9EURY|nr:MAG: S-layer protein [Candidatus Argoarchaeum ethanivorans]